MRSKLSFFRSLWPSWRFFDDLGASPQLFYRHSNSNLDQEAWIPYWDPYHFRWSHLFLNSEGNSRHLLSSLLEQTLNEAAQTDSNSSGAFENTVSYQLLKNWVEFKVAHMKPAKKYYQFKVTALSKEKFQHEDIIISNNHEI